MSVPVACQHIEDQIRTLELAKATEFALLLAAAPGEKDEFAKVIKQINGAINGLQDDLVDCIAANTPIPSAPTLTVTMIQAVQAIQTPDDRAALVAGKRTGVRVFMTSGLPGGPGFPPGAGVVPSTTGSLVVTDVLSNATATLLPLNPGAVADAPPAASVNLDRDDQSLRFELPPGFLQGTVRLDARIFPLGQPPPPVPLATKTVTFLPQPSQEILPVLLSDPVLLLNAPSRASFASSLAGARRRMPLAEQGFVVKPPIETALSPGIDLRGELGWGWLIFNLVTWTFLFPTQDVGGLRTAMVPNDSRYAPVCGVGAWRLGLTVPASAVRAGLPASLAHEMGHAFGVRHAPCPARGMPGEPADIDDQLPGRLRYPGLDVAAGTVVPSRTGEIMSYCPPGKCEVGGPRQSRWPSEDYWEAVRTRVPI
jgi:hypothetical protein